MILRISVPASAWLEDTEETSEKIESALDEISHDEIFSEYLIDDPDPNVKNIPVSGGILTFKWSSRHGLQALVDYEIQARLNITQTKALIAYTLGQLSDGIGNNFVQEYGNETGVFVSISTHEVTPKVEYL